MGMNKGLFCEKGIAATLSANACTWESVTSSVVTTKSTTSLFRIGFCVAAKRRCRCKCVCVCVCVYAHLLTNECTCLSVHKCERLMFATHTSNTVQNSTIQNSVMEMNRTTIVSQCNRVTQRNAVIQ